MRKYGLSGKQLDRIPEKTKLEIVEAVNEGMKYVSSFSYGIVIIYGESHKPVRKQSSRKWEIEWKSEIIAKKTGADYEEVKERFLREMAASRFIQVHSTYWE